MSRIGPGRIEMVDVTGKIPTVRTAEASGFVAMRPATLRRIREGTLGKGDLLAVARIAGIQAAKRTGDWIPLCHPLALGHAEVDLSPRLRPAGLAIRAVVRCTGPTGVEMEALAAVAAAALTVYDMAKSIDRGMVIGPIRLERKEGGQSGLWQRHPDPRRRPGALRPRRGR